MLRRGCGQHDRDLLAFAPQGNKGIFQISGYATDILDRGSDWQVDLGNRKIGHCAVAGADGVAEGQSLGAGTANIGCS